MTMLSKTRASLKAAGLLENPEYEAACELALTYARQIDRGVKAGGQDATKALYLGPHLLKTMSELGLTPASSLSSYSRCARSASARIGVEAA